MVVTRTWVTCRRYIIPLFRRRPPGLHTPYKRKVKEWETKNETIILRTQLFQPICPTTNEYSSMATFRRIRCIGKYHFHWLVVKPMPTPFVPGRDPMKRRREERNKKPSKSDPGSISRLSNTCSNAHHSHSSYLSACVIVGIRQCYGELPLLTWHRWELPRPASAIAVNRICQLHRV